MVEKVKAAQNKRARRLADAVVKWQRLASQGQYPRSLHDILRSALEREYRLGFTRARKVSEGALDG